MEQVPNQGFYVQVAAARISEIKALDAQLDKCEHGGRAYQRLPRHMQRRTVSSNPRRLPRSLREKNNREIGSKIKVSKRPSRKYRRRPSNLLSEYNRRQRENIWLETHVWHAKRFHMKKQWGYSLAQEPTNKSYRSTLRAATESCLLQDVSYENCIECEGPLDVLLPNLNSLLLIEDTKKLSEPEALHGKIWQSVTFHQPKRAPLGAIGSVQIQWIPSCHCEKSNLRKAWLWVHPSIHKDIITTLISVFSLTLMEDELQPGTNLQDGQNLHISAQPTRVDRVQSSKLALKPLNRIVSYTSETTEVTVNLLKDALNKFRLVGPLSQAVLKRTFISSDVSTSNANDSWWRNYYANDLHLKSLKEEVEHWTLMETLPSVPLVIGFVARDPRVCLPRKKNSLLPLAPLNGGKTALSATRFAHGCHPIYNSRIRTSVTSTMKSTEEINRRRSEALVPGFEPESVTEDENRVPVCFLFRPSSHYAGLGSGWDVVLPCGYASVAWVSLIMNGAVAGGQTQSECLLHEFLSPPPACYVPDTTAGKEYEQIIRRGREEDYFKRPPNCRCNFIKLGVKFPFQPNWSRLFLNWNSNSEFYVLRDKRVLSYLSRDNEKIKMNVDNNNAESFYRNTSRNKRRKVTPKDCRTSNECLTSDVNLEMIDDRCLIYVRLVVLDKGTISPMAMICAPEADDWGRRSPSKDSECVIEETIHADTNEKLREDLKSEHKKALLKMRRVRHNARADVRNEEAELNESKSLLTREENVRLRVEAVNQTYENIIDDISCYASKMNNLWLIPEESDPPICRRKTMGYITHGGFCLRLGRSGGVGYALAKPLLALIKSRNSLSSDGSESSTRQIHVLVRNPSQFRYFWARLVVLDVV